MTSAPQIRRQMSCTRDEFMSWLPGATRHSPFSVVGDTVTISTEGGSVEITLEQNLPRRAGLMTLPVLDIGFRFTDLDDAARERFLAYFDLYTRRGGG